MARPALAVAVQPARLALPAGLQLPAPAQLGHCAGLPHQRRGRVAGIALRHRNLGVVEYLLTNTKLVEILMRSRSGYRFPDDAELVLPRPRPHARSHRAAVDAGVDLQADPQRAVLQDGLHADHEVDVEPRDGGRQTRHEAVVQRHRLGQVESAGHKTPHHGRCLLVLPHLRAEDGPRHEVPAAVLEHVSEVVGVELGCVAEQSQPGRVLTHIVTAIPIVED